MTRSIGVRAGMAVVTLVLTVCSMAAFGGLAASAEAAAATNPCKVIKRSEIQRVFGGTVSTGKKGVGTPASAQCEFTVSADGDRPAGTVIVHLLSTGAKAAYDEFEQQTSRYTPVDGVPDAIYSDTGHVVNLLAGGVLVSVQGAFTITDPLPIHYSDDRSQLAQLAQQGAKRV
jgi:hypothetical protein